MERYKFEDADPGFSHNDAVATAIFGIGTTSRVLDMQYGTVVLYCPKAYAEGIAESLNKSPVT